MNQPRWTKIFFSFESFTDSLSVNILVFLFICGIGVGCEKNLSSEIGQPTAKDQTPSPPTIEKYRTDGALMLNVATKFVHESNPKRLHEVAVATQLSRAMECTDYFGECFEFRKILNEVITAASDSNYTPQERTVLENRLKNLKKTIAQGELKLK